MISKNCYHCGDDVIGRGIIYDEKAFCCNGCTSVYKLLSTSELGSFYELEENAGVRPSDSNEHKYAFLEVDEIRKKYIDFEDDQQVHVTLYLPKIHCSSCIYLLENLAKIEPAVQSCQVNFAKRSATIVFDKTQTTLSALSLLLDKIGYAPNYSSQKEIQRKRNYTYLYKLGVAGFAFGSIMLWTFPEYLGIENDNPEFRSFTSYLSFAVSIPVLLYSANEYIISAYKALKFGSINLDVPITLGIIALYAQSSYNIFNGLGPGYMDSFAGFIFFLLIGKWFQSKTYDSLSFERDYTSYFPVAVTKKKKSSEEIVEIDELSIGDHILIRNEEVIPCDVELLSDRIKIDYSFVTGESELIEKKKGDFIYAGGKLFGQIAEFEVKKESSRSHLTQLWNDATESENQADSEESDKLSIWFLTAVILIAATTGVFWFLKGGENITEIIVSVLIVACPCALALSKPFTYGNTMRVLGRKGLYLKNARVIEKINEITDIVFDKTGTLTTGSSDKIEYSGRSMDSDELGAVLQLANSSTHPLSRIITQHLKDELVSLDKVNEISHFEETMGQGVEANIGNKTYKLGSAKFVRQESKRTDNETASHISVDGHYVGRFIFHSELRSGVDTLLPDLERSYEVHIISGDKNKDLDVLTPIVKTTSNIQFEQTPIQKKEYIKTLQESGQKIMMLGDGLNDAGALKSADVGIAVSEDIFRFTPSSDAIIMATKLNLLNRFLAVSKHARTVLLICYIFSVVYNIVGLTFAVTGNLTPLIAAILMPLSSISIVLISTIFTMSKR
jgi:Cu+-exporting ATPase